MSILLNEIQCRKYDWIEYEDGTVLGRKEGECKGNQSRIVDFLTTLCANDCGPYNHACEYVSACSVA